MDLISYLYVIQSYNIYNNGVKVAKGGVLLITIILLLNMSLAIEGWSFYSTPLSLMGAHPATKRYFSYFIVLQTVILSVLYKRRNVKPFLVFVGLASLILVSIYDMKNFSYLHSLFAVLFFLCQPLLFFLEYRKKKDPYELTKGAVLLLLMVLLLSGVIPIPIFELLSYALLILFL